MQSIMSVFTLPATPFVFSPTSLYARLLTLTDERDPRGVRYPLAALLTIATLALLAEQNGVRAVAEWAKFRAPVLADLFSLARPTMPHPTTWSRVLGNAVDPAQFAQVVADFLRADDPMPPARGQVALCLDGKTLRGTIPAGQCQGVHLLAAYLPGQGVTLVEVAVGNKENEIVVARDVLAQVAQPGVVITGDAMFAQHDLSRQVSDAGADYIWAIKKNQPDAHAAIALLFAHPPVPISSDSLAVAHTVETGHGRYEERTLTASTLLNDYLHWPAVAQVFQVQRRTRVTGYGWREHTVYGVTSLPPAVADANRLLVLIRGHWGIENGLFHRRDVTLGEDHSLVRRGHAPQILASLHDLVLGLLAHAAQSNAATARRFYAAFPACALALLTS